MINTLLTNLSTALSRIFVIGIVPLLAFIILHAITADAVFPRFHAWLADSVLTEFKEPGLVTVIGALLVITVAYVWSSLSVFLREVLEGKYLPRRLAEFVGSRYAGALNKAERRLLKARDELNRLVDREPQWEAELKQARQEGSRTGNCSYRQRSELLALINARAAGDNIDAAAIGQEVAALVAVLKNNSAELIGNPESDQLDKDFTELRLLRAYSRSRWSSQAADALEEVEFDFAGRKLTASRMGNIAQSTVYYGQTRYGLNLSVFWPRLQDVLSKNEKLNTQLDEANSRLDFVISLFWHTLLYTLVWVIVLPVCTRELWLFVTVAAAGPLASYLWYHVALQNYRGLASVMRVAVDLHRRGLLEELKVAAPLSLNQERALWVRLEQHIAYNSRNDLPLEAEG